MSFIDAISDAGTKPPSSADRSLKKNYAQKLSSSLAMALATGLRKHGIKNCYPNSEGRGEDRSYLGSIGAKQVDVHSAQGEAGLLLGVSIKTINYIPTSNLANRCEDLMFESVTLHGRFPFAVLGALLILDKAAYSDSTPRRHSTFGQANSKLKLYSGRKHYSEASEKYELIGLGIYDANSSSKDFELFEVGEAPKRIDESEFYDRLSSLVKQRNPEIYRKTTTR